MRSWGHEVGAKFPTRHSSRQCATHLIAFHPCLYNARHHKSAPLLKLLLPDALWLLSMTQSTLTSKVWCACVSDQSHEHAHTNALAGVVVRCKVDAQQHLQLLCFCLASSPTIAATLQSCLPSVEALSRGQHQQLHILGIRMF
eukprot:1146288-Pelagomonas_calceolata.AAC.2